MKALAITLAIGTAMVFSSAAQAGQFTRSVFMELLGEASAFEELCDGLSIDEDVMKQAARDNRIDASVFDDLNNQARFKNAYLTAVQSAASFSEKAAFCDMGLMSYGKDGVNIPNLLVKK